MAFIGAPYYNSGSGIVYLYYLYSEISSEYVWSFQSTIISSPCSSCYFGSSIAFTNELALVGANGGSLDQASLNNGNSCTMYFA